MFFPPLRSTESRGRENIWLGSEYWGIGEGAHEAAQLFGSGGRKSVWGDAVAVLYI
jgi:hypothetical protein